MTLTAHAAGLLADSAGVLSQAADADVLTAGSCEEVLCAVEQTLVSLRHALTTIETSLPGGVPRCREVVTELETLTALLRHDPVSTFSKRT